MMIYGPRIYIKDHDLWSGHASENIDDILNVLVQQPIVGKIYATPEFTTSNSCYKGRKDSIEHISQTIHGEVKITAH